MINYSEIVIFTKMNIDSVLIFWEAFRYLKLHFLCVTILPVSGDSEILEIFSDYNNLTQDIIFLLIGGETKLYWNKIILEKKLKLYFKKNFKLSKNTVFSLNDHIFIDQLCSIELTNNQKIIKVKPIDITNFFKNWEWKSNNFNKKVDFHSITTLNFQDYVWINAITIWHLYLSGNFSSSHCCRILKKISWVVKVLFKKKKNLKMNENKYKFVFSKELPFYFLYHHSIFESLLNTPSIIIDFEIWKKDGFSKIFQFLGRISIFKENIGKYWNKYNEEEKKEILKCFKFEIKKFGTPHNLIYNFKQVYKNLTNLFELSSLDLALTLRSMFDLKIRNLMKNVKKKIFWDSFKCLIKLGNIKRFVIKEKYVQQFISRVSRLVLSKKTFISRRTMRILYLSSFDDITYEMIKGLLKILISVFNKNKLLEKLILLIIKETVSTTVFISHQNKNDFVLYNNLITSNSFLEVIQSIKIEKNILIIKFPSEYERQILLTLLKIEIKK